MSVTRVAVEVIRGALRAADVLDYAGVRYRRSGRELRAACPLCGSASREPLCINSKSGAFSCKVCDARGDLLALLARLEGLDVRQDFGRVLALGAQLAGIDSAAHDDAELARRVDERRRADAEHERQRQAERERAIADVPARWDRLARRSIEGERYLADARGIDPRQLIERDACRFTADGDVVVQLFDVASGRPINLVTRRRITPEGAPKVFGLRRCPASGSLVMPVSRIDEGADVSVLTEGVADTLAAMVAFPTCVVIGAHGASQLVDVAAAIVPRVVAVRGWLMLVPHADAATGRATGEDAMVNAGRIALAAGLVLDDSLRLVYLAPHKDLAEAIRAGWSWSWPS